MLQAAYNRVSKKVSIEIILIISAFLLTQFSMADTTSGISWLKTQQQSNGAYSNETDISTELQATAEVLETYKILNENIATTTKEVVKNSGQDNTETLSRKLISGVLTSPEKATTVAELISRQNADGGFGEFEGYHSTPLDTAFVLQAFSTSPPNNLNIISKAVSYLLDIQTSNGGFSHSSVNTESIYETALVSIALQRFRFNFNLSSVISDASDFLLNNKTGGDWGTTWETAHALLALIPVVSDVQTYQSAVDNLRSAQTVDGSWSQDVYATALALRALYKADNTQTPISLTEGIFTGQVLNTADNQPIVGAIIKLTDIAGYETTTTTDGSFTLTNMPAGEHTVSATAAGFNSASKTATAVAGSFTSLGVVRLSPLSNKGVIFGVVRDTETNQPLASATVNITGSTTATVMTDSEGLYNVEVNIGQLSILIQADGHDSVSVNADIPAGQRLNFSPLLNIVGTTVATTVTTRVTIVDADTNLPIQGALVKISGTNISGLTNSDGRSVIENITAGTITVELTATGYQSATASTVASPGSVINLGVISLSKINANPNPAIKSVVSGVVRDAKTNAVIESATVVISGSTSATISTNNTGFFSIELEAGQVEITIQHNGYDSVSTGMDVTTDQKFSFSPLLSLTNTNPAKTTVTTKVTIIDANTNLPIQGALVSISGTTISGTTDSDGKLVLENITAGSLNIEMTATDYQTLVASAVATQGSIVDLGIVSLSKIEAITTRTIKGVVTSAVTGVAITGATIAVEGTSISVTSDSQGHYLIDDVGLATFRLIVSANGFLSNEGDVTLEQPGHMIVNIQLGKKLTEGVNIQQIHTDANQYLAYKTANISTLIKNTGNTKNRVQVFAEIINAQHEAIYRMSLNPPNVKGSFGSGSVIVPAYDVEAGESVELVGLWFTGVSLAGNYKIKVEVFSESSGQLLSQEFIEITVKPTTKINISIKPTPVYTSFEAERQVELVARIRNLSNVPIETQYNYSLLDPDGVAVKSGVIAVQIAPDEQLKTIVLDSFTYTFNKTGIYSLDLQFKEGIIATRLHADSITVAPTIRVEASESITPTTILPNGDKRIRINIQLKGVQQQ